MNFSDNFTDIRDTKVGTILRSYKDRGVQVVIIRGPVSMNVYLGIPKKHPIAGRHYDEIHVPCHGGLTYASAQLPDNAPWPEELYWFGYDYAHGGDFLWFDRKYDPFKGAGMSLFGVDKKWSLGEIVDEAYASVSSLRAEMRKEKLKKYLTGKWL